MDCNNYIELMSAALDGELTAEERRELDAHLAVCPECADLFKILAANARAARELDCEMPADLKDRIMSNLPAQEAAPKKGKVISWKRWVPVAAAACLALVVTLIPHSGNNGSSAPMQLAPAASQDMSVADGAKYGHNPAEMAPVPSTAPVAMPSEEPQAPPAGEPAHYWLGNQQAISVGYSDELSAGAQIVGNTESLDAYLAQFMPQRWDAEGNPVRNVYLEALKETYTEEFFQTRRLLCVTVISGSGSIRYEFAPQGLLRYSVTVLEHRPEIGTCDMAAWLLVAEVDTMFHDGDTLDVIFTH